MTDKIAIYGTLDPGTDDIVALIQLLAELIHQNGTLKLLGVSPSDGNAVLLDTLLNTACMMYLTNNQHIPIFPGSQAPLRDQCNQTAIAQVEAGINGFPFYGPHGLPASVPRNSICPTTTASIQPSRGYRFIADSVAKTKDPIAILCTSSLSEIAKAVTELALRNPATGFAENIAGIYIMGGVIEKNYANAPFNWPHCGNWTASDLPCQDAEANFYFDPDAARIVFDFSDFYKVKLYLAPLDLTQQRLLLWGPEQTDYLANMTNNVAQQIARIVRVIPEKDQQDFPKGFDPMHDLHAIAAFLYPLYNTTRKSYRIGDHGQMIDQTRANESLNNVFVLSMDEDHQKDFYKTILPAYRFFDNQNLPNSTSGFFQQNNVQLDLPLLASECVTPTNIDSNLFAKILILGAPAMILLMCLAYCLYACLSARKKESEPANENRPLLA